MYYFWKKQCCWLLLNDSTKVLFISDIKKLGSGMVNFAFYCGFIWSIRKKAVLLQQYRVRRRIVCSVSPPNRVGAGITLLRLVKMETKFLIDANGITVDVASFRALVANQSTAQDYFGEKAPRNPSLVYMREWCEKELRKRSRHVENLQKLRAYCMAEQARLDAAEV